MTTKIRYRPISISGTSGSDHLDYEVEEQLEDSYSSRASAERGWLRACARADSLRRRQGLTPVSRSACRAIPDEQASE